MEVRPLSRQGNRCSPYPTHYRSAFASSMILCPTQHRMALRPALSAIVARRYIGFTLFRKESTDWEGSAYSPVIVLSAYPHQPGG